LYVLNSFFDRASLDAATIDLKPARCAVGFVCSFRWWRIALDFLRWRTPIEGRQSRAAQLGSFVRFGNDLARSIRDRSDAPRRTRCRASLGSFVQPHRCSFQGRLASHVLSPK
jgi:hypothetical protein